MTPSKLAEARAAVEAVPDGATVGILGAGGGILEPDLLIAALGQRFVETGNPTDLTLVHSTGLGDRLGRGLEPLAHQGLVRRVVGGHFGMCPQMSDLVHRGLVEAYNLPLGVLSLLFRESAAGRPGLITKIGLGTFIDPRQDGGRLNDVTPPGLVELIELDGEEYLFYRSIPIDVALVRGSVADANGNVSFVDETSYLDAYELAAAGHCGGGRVIAQVKRVVETGAIAPKDVRIPGILVDTVVEHPGQWQTYAGERNDAYAGLVRAAVDVPPMPLGPRKVIVRRAVLELRAGDVVNLGVGIPDGVACVLAEEGMTDQVTLTVEHGIVGGVTARGTIFGASVNHSAVISMPEIIDLYQGGALDIAFLGFAQVDKAGNVNVSKYGDTVMGTGGFIDITQHTERVVFCGTLTAGGLKADYPDGNFRLLQEGTTGKLVDTVDQITFSGRLAAERGQQVLYVTERAVFELTPEGVELVEVAPGVDVERDVLALCGFRPLMRGIRTMPASVTLDGVLGLERALIASARSAPEPPAAGPRPYGGLPGRSQTVPAGPPVPAGSTTRSGPTAPASAMPAGASGSTIPAGSSGPTVCSGSPGSLMPTVPSGRSMPSGSSGKRVARATTAARSEPSG